MSATDAEPGSVLRSLIDELEARREKAALGGRIEKIERQHARDKLTARERLALLIDKGTFTELGIHGGPHFSEFSVMGAEGAVNIIGRSIIEASDDPERARADREDAVRQTIDPYIAAANAMIDDVIDPRETRPTVIRALELAEGKRVERPFKKHGVMPV